MWLEVHNPTTVTNSIAHVSGKGAFLKQSDILSTDHYRCETGTCCAAAVTQGCKRRRQQHTSLGTLSRSGIAATAETKKNQIGRPRNQIGDALLGFFSTSQA
jgi:hypothetical protein